MKRKKLLPMLSALAACMVFVSCAPKRSNYQTTVLHQNDRLTSDVLSGQQILIFPLITNEGFDTSKGLTQAELHAMITELRGDFELHDKAEFEREFLLKKKRSAEELSLFYTYLAKADLISLQTSDSVWYAMPWPYAMTLRLVGGSRVQGFDRKIKRQVNIEGELWDTRDVQVVWRATAVGLETDAESSDMTFFRSGIREIFMKLPGYRPAANEANW